MRIATEGALWGSIAEQGLLDGTVIVSDGAGRRSWGAASIASSLGSSPRACSTERGFATLDRLLARPQIPLHTNGSENDIRCQVTRRKISAGTRSDLGRDSRDAFLGLMKTCAKQAISFWDYLGDRLGVPDAPAVQSLAELIRAPASA